MSAPLLLDTHILVWAVTEPERVSTTARQIIERAELIYVSAVSAWEIVQLADRGRDVAVLFGDGAACAIATARVHDLVLVTADRRIREWPDVNTA